MNNDSPNTYLTPKEWIDEGVMVLANNMFAQSRSIYKSLDELVSTLKQLGGAETDEEAKKALSLFLILTKE